MCSSDIYHLKLIEIHLTHRRLQRERKTNRRLSATVTESRAKIRTFVNDLLCDAFCRSLSIVVPSFCQMDRRTNFSVLIEEINDTMKTRKIRRPNFIISKNVVTTSNCLICIYTYDVSLASMNTPIWATTIIIFLSRSLSLLRALFLSFSFVLFSFIYTYRLNSIDFSMCVHVSSFFRDECASSLLFPFFLSVVYSNNANYHITVD